MWDSVVEVIAITSGVDDTGDLTEQQTFIQIFCNELSIGQTEFYQAQANGFKAEIKIEVNRLDYNNEKRVKYNNRLYDVIRTYSKDSDVIELTLGDGVNGTT